MVNAGEGQRQVELWWRLQAMLTCKLLVAEDKPSHLTAGALRSFPQDKWSSTEGKTFSVEPANPYPSLLTTSHSESHWTTPTTLTAFLTWPHEPGWQQSHMDLLHGRVFRARQSGVPGPP